jgi:hypothetical protein
MKIDKALNLVIPLESGWVHATPISYAIFEKYFLPISKAFARVYAEGLGSLAGPRVAYMILKQVSIEDGLWGGPEGVEKGLMNEIYRLTNVMLPSDNGWNTLPMYEATRQNLLNDSEVSEVTNALVFFTLASVMHRTPEKVKALAGMTKFWDGQTTSLDCTAYKASLPTLTPVDSTGVTPIVSSVPS